MTQTHTEPTPADLVTNGIRRAIEDLRLTGGDVARITGISEASVSRLRKGNWKFQEGSKSYELALMLLRVHLTLKSVVRNNVGRMRDWLKAHNDALGSAPIALLTRIQGLVKVLRHLERMRPALAAAG